MVKYLSILLFIPGFVIGQIQNPVSISAMISSPVRAGEVVNINIIANMEDNWRIYSVHKLTEGPLPTRINVSGGVVGATASVQEPKPKYVFDPAWETDTYRHEGNTNFIFPIRLKKSIQPGDYPIVVDVYFMVVNDRLAYPPTTKTDTVIITVEPGETRYERTLFANDIIIEDLSNKVELLEKRIEKIESLISNDKASVKKIYQERWKNLDSWRQLKLGMNPDEVRSILGEPTRIKLDDEEELWRYGRYKEKENGKLIFNFRTQKLKSWDAP